MREDPNDPIHRVLLGMLVVARCVLIIFAAVGCLLRTPYLLKAANAPSKSDTAVHRASLRIGSLGSSEPTWLMVMSIPLRSEHGWIP
jgi:hypothetical protein